MSKFHDLRRADIHARPKELILFISRSAEGNCGDAEKAEC